jgi:hypothetical protein
VTGAQQRKVAHLPFVEDARIEIGRPTRDKMSHFPEIGRGSEQKFPLLALTSARTLCRGAQRIALSAVGTPFSDVKLWAPPSNRRNALYTLGRRETGAEAPAAKQSPNRWASAVGSRMPRSPAYVVTALQAGSGIL